MGRSLMFDLYYSAQIAAERDAEAQKAREQESRNMQVRGRWSLASIWETGNWQVLKDSFFW